MPLDHYLTLGRSGLRVSPMCLGTMTFGEDWGWGASVEESEAILAHYLDRGGTFIDPANAYTRPLGSSSATRSPGRPAAATASSSPPSSSRISIPAIRTAAAPAASHCRRPASSRCAG
jgi:hypothetical protein